MKHASSACVKKTPGVLVLILTLIIAFGTAGILRALPQQGNQVIPGANSVTAAAIGAVCGSASSFLFNNAGVCAGSGSLLNNTQSADVVVNASQVQPATVKIVSVSAGSSVLLSVFNSGGGTGNVAQLGSAIFDSTGNLSMSGTKSITGISSASGGNIPIVTSFTTTAATTDNVTVTGMTASGHCVVTPTNAGAAGGIASVFVSAKTTNQITVTHTATAAWTFDVACTPN